MVSEDRNFRFGNLKNMKPAIYRVLTAIYLWLSALSIQGQNKITVAGKLADLQGRPVPQALIEIQEGTGSTVSDDRGHFTIEAANGDVLVISSRGFHSVFAEVRGGQIDDTIVLEASLAEAGDDDVVQIPFGTRKKREINGAVSFVRGDNLPQISLSSLSNLLSGRIPGLYLAQTGTQPGRDDANFFVRNRTTYTGNNSPLILVDGVVRDFADMDLNEIASVTVLKDAVSLAWYGNRSANGVIMVTTHRGSPTKTRFTYDLQLGTQQPTALTKPLDSYTFGRLYNSALHNDGFPGFYSEEDLNGYKNGQDLYRYPNNNFVKDYFKKNAFVQRHVFTASGGSRAVRYFTTLSYFDQNGLYRNSKTPSFDSNVGYNRYNIRTNLDIDVTKTLSVQLDIGGRIEDRREPGSGNASFLNTIYSTPANAYPLLNADGSYGGSNLFRNNPQAQLQSQGFISEVTRVMLGNLKASQQLNFILKGLSGEVFYTFDLQGRYTSGRSQEYEVYEQLPTGDLVRYGTETPLNYRNSTFSDNIRTNEFWGGFNYQRVFDKHSVKGIVRYQQASSIAANRFDDKRQGISAWVSYAYNNRYYLDVVNSYTGADNYMPGKQFGYFPAMAVGWVISDEPFMEGTRGTIDYLKLRGSYGRVGNNATGEANKFPYAYLFSQSNGNYVFGTGFSAQPGASERTLPNPDITWEKAYKTDIGFDLKLWKNRVYFSGTYFNEHRRDILTNPINPSVLGLGSFRVNQGQSQLRGLETVLNVQQNWGDWSLNLGGNFTLAKNKSLWINESAGLLDYQVQTGHRMGNVNGFSKTMLVSQGLFQSQEEIDQSPVQRFAGKVQPGDIRYKDINNDGVIDSFDGIMTDYNDIPDRYYGFNLVASYKAFDFSVLLQGIAGRTVQIRSLVLSGSNNTGYINEFSQHAWSPENPDGIYPRLGITDRGNNTPDSDFWLRSGDYLRLKSLEVGYNFPQALTSKLNIRSLRLYLNGFNLLSFSKLGMGLDPEIPFAGYIGNYPYQRNLTAGINLKF